ncbi:MAG TPA: PspC domain-containing protein [Dehalococcoidales bacterium]|jgi:phage shock protein C|nr:PspC domain-containing protein [Dehalococcoidales bacterium]
MEKKLYRSRTDRKLVGVCGGLGKYFDIDPTIVRIVFVALLFCGTLGFWLYIAMAIIVPEEPAASVKPDDIIKK